MSRTNTTSQVDLAFRPLDDSSWIEDGRTTYLADRWGSTWGKTERLLRYELGRLGVERAVLEIPFRPEDLRVTDGLPRANARQPDEPRVRLSFEAPEIGPQCFMCDTFERWQENAHGIALTLQRLRLIEEYGATRGKQQYRGWGALPERATDGFATAQEAAEFLGRQSGYSARSILESGENAATARRKALARNHPDKGGTHDITAKINAAWEKLKK